MNDTENLYESYSRIDLDNSRNINFNKHLIKLTENPQTDVMFEYFRLVSSIIPQHARVISRVVVPNILGVNRLIGAFRKDYEIR